MATGPEAFLELLDACGLRPCDRTHLKKRPCATLVHWWGIWQISPYNRCTQTTEQSMKQQKTSLKNKIKLIFWITAKHSNFRPLRRNWKPLILNVYVKSWASNEMTRYQIKMSKRNHNSWLMTTHSGITYVSCNIEVTEWYIYNMNLNEKQLLVELIVVHLTRDLLHSMSL